MRMNTEVRKGLLNLHDAFLNAALAEREKWKAPVEEDPKSSICLTMGASNESGLLCCSSGRGLGVSADGASAYVR